MTQWPESVWRSPWLEGLDAGARAKLEAAGDLRTLEPGESLFAPGQVADTLFVVADGVVDLVAVRRGDAKASTVRRALAGDALGEEAVVRSGSSRLSEARCSIRSRVVGIPSGVYQRLWDRAGKDRRTQERERALHDAAARDVIASSSLARGLDGSGLAAAARRAEHRQLSRGEIVFAQGDPVDRWFVVADGMVAVEAEDDGRVRIKGYLQRGDLIADTGPEGRVHLMTARACGSIWVLSLPADVVAGLARSRPKILESARRIVTQAPAAGTAHVGADLWRYAVAGSMLVIDDEACVRCGHCAWSCADTHDDGISRLLRRGEKIRVHDAVEGALRAMLVPGSCQHCKHPACMIDCPTGAIGRGPRGQVAIRQDICVGCGQCERACPWGSVHMAPRSPLEAATSLSAQVAVKCDLCADLASGPACVRACPVEAIARVEPVAAMADVRAVARAEVPRSSLPRSRSPLPWVVGALLPAIAMARLGRLWGSSSLASGVVAGVLVLVLLAYSAVKRTRLRNLAWMPGTRAHAVAHLSIGILTGGVVLAHAAGRAPANAAGAALMAFTVASITGILAGVAYGSLPSLLARIEPRARLIEDLAPRARELDERTFAALSGRSPASKALYEQILGPYAKSLWGGLGLVVWRRTLPAEEARLMAHLASVTEGRAEHHEGLRDLISLVVERRAVRAQWALQLALRACVPAHVVAVGIAVALIVVHVISILGSR